MQIYIILKMEEIDQALKPGVYCYFVPCFWLSLSITGQWIFLLQNSTYINQLTLPHGR